MQFERSSSVTQCETAEIRSLRSPQHPGIASEREKAPRADHFCLTESVRGGYFAGSSPSGCGGKEAASATRCGAIVDIGGSACGWQVESFRMERCVWLEVCCGIRN